MVELHFPNRSQSSILSYTVSLMWTSYEIWLMQKKSHYSLWRKNDAKEMLKMIKMSSQYIWRTMHVVCFLLWLCINWFYWGLLQWHWGNHKLPLVPVRWRIWLNESCDPTRNYDITSAKQGMEKPMVIFEDCWCQKQVSQAGISNYILQYSVICNY